MDGRSTSTDCGRWRVKPLTQCHRSGDEADVYRALGLDFIQPELRENSGELEAASGGGLPDLVKLENLRGVFITIPPQAMAKPRCVKWQRRRWNLACKYLGIADHSKGSFQANGLDANRLRKQMVEIRKLQRRIRRSRLPHLHRQRGGISPRTGPDPDDELT